MVKNNNAASSDSHERSNFLYQAGQTAAEQNSPLALYYNYLAKEVMKKIVGKMHPNLTRTMCSRCCYPLSSAGKILPAKRKKAVKRKNKRSHCVKGGGRLEGRITVRNKRPNRVRWDCLQCNYQRTLLQRPSHTLTADRE